MRRGGLAQLEPVIAAIEATGGLDYAAARAGEHARRAEQALEGLPASAWLDALRGLARYAVLRDR